MKLLRLLVLFGAMAALVSCSSDGEQRPEYMHSSALERLEIPPELTIPSGNEELRIPLPSAKALAALKSHGAVEGRVAPKFKNIELQSEAGMYWLLLQRDADNVWPILRDFLANEGLEIHRDEPLLGFIETEWVQEYEANRDAGFLQRMFNGLSVEQLDKFRLRVERVEGRQQTRLYISHRGLQIIAAEDGSRWQQSMPGRMLEKELLYRMVLFAGLSEAKADNVFADYTPYQARIRSLGEDDSVQYEITGKQSFVWQRIIQAIDRLGLDVKNQDETAGTLAVLVKGYKQKSNGQKVNDKDERDDVLVFVKLQILAGSTRMQLSQQDNQPLADDLANKFKNDLVELLK
jgi:outer membrane protein assembly factor BamC